jgi:hypothetical protein
MSFGMRIWGATGALELDENSFTVRVTYSEVVQSGQPAPGYTRFIPIPGVDPSTHSAVCIPIANYDTGGTSMYAIQYIPIVSSGGVTIFFGQPGAPSGSSLGLAPQRLIVMRFR